MKYGSFYDEEFKQSDLLDAKSRIERIKKEHDRKVGASVGCIILTVWGLGFLLVIAAGLGLAWAAVHFIIKWW